MLSPAPRATRGFTLIELIIVIVVLGVLAALAVPTFTSTGERSRAGVAETTAKAVLSQAKADAVGKPDVRASVPAAIADLPAGRTGAIYDGLRQVLSVRVQNTVREAPVTAAGLGPFAPGTVSGTGASYRVRTIASGLSYPAGVVIGVDGNIYVAEMGPRVMRVSPAGAVSVLASVSGASWRGMAQGPDGALYVADVYGERIFRIAMDGSAALWAGTGVQGAADGARLSATLCGPHDLSFDTAGVLYVGEIFCAARVRRIDTAGNVTTLASGVGATLQWHAGWLYAQSGSSIVRLSASGPSTPTTLVTIPPTLSATGGAFGMLGWCGDSLVFARQNPGWLLRVPVDGNPLSQLAGTGVRPGDGPAGAARLGRAWSGRCDSTGSYVFGDIDAGQLRILELAR